MKKTAPFLFRVTGIIIFVQLILGGLLTFNFIVPLIHIVTGFIVLVLAVATMITTFVAKPTFKTLRGMSIGLVILIAFQIILGLETLQTNNSLLAWLHFVVAMGIYGMAVSGTFLSMGWKQAANTQTKEEQMQKS
jgi:heme A synthase